MTMHVTSHNPNVTGASVSPTARPVSCELTATGGSPEASAGLTSSRWREGLGQGPGHWSRRHAASTWRDIARGIASCALLLSGSAEAAALDRPARRGLAEAGEVPRSCATQLTRGYWAPHANNHADLRWNSLSEECSLVDGATKLVENDLSIFTLGDSVDHRLLEDICEQARRNGKVGNYSLIHHESSPDGEYKSHGWDSFAVCALEKGIIHHAYLTGLSKVGLMDFPERHSNRLATVRLQHARDHFLSLRGGAPPDIIVFSANFWDNSAMERANHGITNITRLREWRDNFKDMLTSIDAAFPDTGVKIYHTSTFTSRSRLPQAVVHGLNSAAASAVDTNKNWVTVDLQAMTNAFSRSGDYLRDLHHAAAFVTHPLFNIYVSLWPLASDRSS